MTLNHFCLLGSFYVSYVTYSTSLMFNTVLRFIMPRIGCTVRHYSNRYWLRGFCHPLHLPRRHYAVDERAAMKTAYWSPPWFEPKISAPESNAFGPRWSHKSQMQLYILNLGPYRELNQGPFTPKLKTITNGPRCCHKSLTITVLLVKCKQLIDNTHGQYHEYHLHNPRPFHSLSRKILCCSNYYSAWCNSG